ncbi:unnamed protein product [Prorocentrum cordatum]|uniref:Rab3 GTPase-activating protein catalytic subunit n=1 Tax=Prorocentrum cordatum TaxID=2364126 RepID=A0ABN9WE10_9DINO|nr:unnamed protein product [Polarella glacialis]
MACSAATTSTFKLDPDRKSKQARLLFGSTSLWCRPASLMPMTGRLDLASFIVQRSMGEQYERLKEIWTLWCTGEDDSAICLSYLRTRARAGRPAAGTGGPAGAESGGEKPSDEEDRGQDFEGLRVAARWARRQQGMDASMAKKMVRLDISCHVNRHINAQKADIQRSIDDEDGHDYELDYFPDLAVHSPPRSSEEDEEAPESKEGIEASDRKATEKMAEVSTKLAAWTKTLTSQYPQLQLSGAADTYVPPPWAAESATAVPSFAEMATVSEDDCYLSLGLVFLEGLDDLPHDILMSGTAPCWASPSARSEVNKSEVADSIGQQVLTNGRPAEDLQLLDPDQVCKPIQEMLGRDFMLSDQLQEQFRSVAVQTFCAEAIPDSSSTAEDPSVAPVMLFQIGDLAMQLASARRLQKLSLASELESQIGVIVSQVEAVSGL